MYYLVDTTPHNECLRVLGGTHLVHHAMHDLPEAHADQLQRVVTPDYRAYQSVSEEIDVCVQSGGLVIGDSRLLHSSHSN